MHISLNERYNTELCNLDWGDAFEFNGAFYMLVRACGLVPDVSKGDNLVCVDICEGDLMIIKGTEKVHQLKTDVIIGEIK